MVTYLQSLQAGLRTLFETDERVYLLGEDVLDPYGGAFKVSQGLSTAFPGRVIATPISEAGIVGVGSGMALRGLRPIVEIMFGDFVTLAADQIINHAAKFRAMYRGQVTVPLVIRTPMGGGRGYGPTHSQNLEKIFLGTPHLRLVAPSHFHDPGTLLQAAVLQDEGPVLFIEHKLLYPAVLLPGSHGALSLEWRGAGSPYVTAIVRNFSEGAPDVALIAYGGTSLLVQPVLERLAAEEIRVVACFPACIQPPPIPLLTDIVRQAKRAVVVEEGTRSFGWGTEIVSALTEALWGQLEAPIKRVAALDTIIPTAKPLEAAVLPSESAIEAAIYEVMT